MGYRDDTVALESRCAAVEQDRDRLRSELERLQTERQRLEHEAHQRRWRLRGRRLLAWAGRHKVLVALLLAGVLIPSYLYFRDHAQRAWEERQLSRLMDRLGCDARLRVTATSRGTVLLDGRNVGETPLRQRVCPGGHLVRVVSDDFFHWQRLVQVPRSGELGLAARLYRLAGGDRPRGALVLSDPPGALVFVNHVEVGRTPAFVAASDHPGSGVVVAVAKEGWRPVRVTGALRHDTLWFRLARNEEPHARSR